MTFILDWRNRWDFLTCSLTLFVPRSSFTIVATRVLRTWSLLCSGEPRGCAAYWVLIPPPCRDEITPKS